MERVKGREVRKPWGREVVFGETERYVGKVIYVKGGHRLSLQYHREKDETIHVWKGRVRIWVKEGGEMREEAFEEGEGIRIKAGVEHRVEAVGDVVLLEVSSGEVGDVVRVEDDYGRVGEEGGWIFETKWGNNAPT